MNRRTIGWYLVALAAKRIDKRINSDYLYKMKKKLGY